MFFPYAVYLFSGDEDPAVGVGLAGGVGEAGIDRCGSPGSRTGDGSRGKTVSESM